jgi:hypothetical protein
MAALGEARASGARMQNANSNEYYMARIEAERQAAMIATCPQARRAHEELALAYEQRIERAIEVSQPHIRSSNMR